MYESIGVLASCAVLFSFVFNNQRKIRITNIVGALLFVIYGLLIGSFSVWSLNLILIFIHLIKLKNMR